MKTRKYYQIIADSGDGDWMVWRTSDADWMRISGDDGEYSTFHSRSEAEKHLIDALADHGYLRNVHIDEYEIEEDDDEEEE